MASIPLGTMDRNPLVEARLSLKLTQAKVASMTGLSHPAIVHAEAGMFAHPLPALVDFYQEVGDFDFTGYREWVRSVRAAHPLRSLPAETLTTVLGSEIGHPFVKFRTMTAPVKSQVGFCKYACVHLSSLQRYESFKQIVMPGQLIEALLEMGVGSPTLKAITDAVYYADKRRRNWKEWH